MNLVRVALSPAESGDYYWLRIRDRGGDDEERVLGEKLGEEREQEIFAVDVFALIGFAQRDERDEGVVAVSRGARGRVRHAEDVFFGCRGGNFAFRHFSPEEKKAAVGTGVS